MSIFGAIMDKIMQHPKAAPASGPMDAAPMTPASTSTGPTGATGTPSTGSAASGAPTPMSEVDVEGVLTEMASKYSHPVNWRESIVDLMSMLGIDNSLAQRKALAQELGYTGDMNDSAKMNMWLHKQVMLKLEENGGKVPASLLR